jgi:protein-L-isoaspartate O-methyltransferase
MSDRIDRIFEPLGVRWLDALRACPREDFAPAQAWVAPTEDSPGYVIDRDVDPAAWEKAVDSDIPIITQLDDGGFGYTSSCSMPSIVTTELGLLRLKRDDDVLEIGTGTGWTAALIAHYVRYGRVVTVEVDEEIHRQAARSLARAGAGNVVPVVGDGVLGHPDGAPYDAVHVTVGSTHAAPAWIGQARPGGTIVFPWMPAWSDRGGAFVSLRPLGDGTAVGRIGPTCDFMMIRAQRAERQRPGLGSDVRERSARVDPQRVVGEWSAMVALAAMLPGVSCSTGMDGGFVLWAHADDGSAAYVRWGEERDVGLSEQRQSLRLVRMSRARGRLDAATNLYRSAMAFVMPARVPKPYSIGMASPPRSRTTPPAACRM